MGISKVELFVNTVDVFPENPTLDVTADVLASQPIVYSVGTPFATRYFFVRITDDAGNTKDASLGAATTQDNTGPVVSSTVVRGDPSVSVLQVDWTISDASGQLDSVYVHIGTTPPADAAAVLATGIPKGLLDTTHSFTGLTDDTLYHVSVMGRDAAGNTTIETKSLATAKDTTPPVLDSFTLRAPTAEEGDAELVVVIEMSVSDVIAEAP